MFLFALGENRGGCLVLRATQSLADDSAGALSGGQVGELAHLQWKLVLVNGPFKGKIFPLIKERVVLGRSKECDVSFNDVGLSREHLELVFIDQRWIATDLKSQNGCYLNGQKMIQSPLKHRDQLVIGNTHFIITDQPTIELKNADGEGRSQQDQTQPKSRKVVLLALLALVGLILVLEDQSDDPVASNKVRSLLETTRPLTEIQTQLTEQQKKQQEELNQDITSLIARGLREYREQNYYRALSEFGHALDLFPGHPQASFYYRKTMEDLDRVISSYSINAHREIESMNYRRAIVSYCAILRLLYHFSDDPRVKETKEKIKQLEQLQGINIGETRCL